jgi:hypothetical protein
LLLPRSDTSTIGNGAPSVLPLPIVEASDQNVVVFQTENPDIVVVWLYQKNGRGT